MQPDQRLSIASLFLYISPLEIDVSIEFAFLRYIKFFKLNLKKVFGKATEWVYCLITTELPRRNAEVHHLFNNLSEII